MVIYFIIFCFLGLLSLLWAAVANLKKERYANRHSFKTYEFGTTTLGNQQRLSHTDYFLLSIFFIIFDVEMLFLFLWVQGYTFTHNYWVYTGSLVLFIYLLAVALGYELANGILTWYRYKR